MERNLQKLKTWYRITQPSFGRWLIAFITCVIPVACYIATPFFAAKVIVFITESNFKLATIWLLVSFGFLLLGSLSWHVNYYTYSKLLSHSYLKINSRLFDKIMSAKDENFKTTSKERILNTLGSDIYTVSNFTDILATKSAVFLRVIVTLIIIFVNSWIAGIIVLAISTFNYFAYEFLNKRVAQANKDTRDSKDFLFEKMTDITQGRDVAGDLGITEKIKGQYIDSCNYYIKTKHKNSVYTSYRDNILYIIWNLIVCLTTIYLIYLISDGTLSIAIYLVIVSYLTSAIEKVNDVFGVFAELKNAGVSCSRIQTILDFTEKDLVQYGNSLKDKIDGTLMFNNVSLDEKDLSNNNYGKISNINLTIKKGQIVLFEGQRQCGKRQIFHLLRRSAKPDEGVITLDGIDLFDYDPSVYRTNLTYTGSKPIFFEGTVMENMQLVEKSKKKIVTIFKEFGLNETILALPEGYDTSIMKNPHMFSEYTKFMMGLARAFLTKSEVVMIYEFPTQLNADDRKNVREHIKNYRNKRTIVLFSASDENEIISDQVFKIQRGKIE